MGWTTDGEVTTADRPRRGAPGSLALDARGALRSLLARPGFTAVAVSTLAVGIGANVTVFSVVDTVLFRDLPFPDAERLLMVWETVAARDEDEAFLSFPDYRDYRAGAGAFEDMAAFFARPNQDVNLTGGAEPERVNVARVTSTYFDVLGVRPALGRTFTPDEDRAGNHRVAILGHALWTRQFGADPSLLGASVQVNGFPYAVVGVMPADFRPAGSLALAEDVEMWRPLAASSEQREDRGWRDLRVVGRLRPGVSIASAGRELEAVSARILEEDPEARRGRGVRVVPLHEQAAGPARRGLYLLWGAVALVQAIACANVANLLLVRAAGRSREISIRASLGATRWRLVRGLLVESVVLAGVGGVAGVLLAWAGVATVRALAAGHTPLVAGAAVDARVLAFTLSLVVGTGLAFGLAPALAASRTDLTRAFREEGGGSVRGGWGAARAFCVAQLTLAVVLLVGAGLLVRSFTALRSADPGFEPEGLLTLQMELPMVTRYPEQEERTRFFEELRERVAGLPGVRSVATASSVPMGEGGLTSTFWIAGRPEPRPEDRPVGDFRLVSPEYFRTLGIPLLRGRGVLATDRSDAPRVVVVNRTMAERYWPGEDPIGAELEWGDGGVAGRVVGVVGDVRLRGPKVAPRPTWYFMADQVGYNFMTLVARTEGPARRALPAVREEVRKLDPELPLHNVRTAEELLTRTVGPEAFTARLLGAFAVVALLLAAVGTYGVMSSAVGRRRRELGVRLALGAAPSDAFLLILREGGALVAGGVGLGLVLAALGSRALGATLHDVGPLDPWAYVGATVALGAAGLGAVAGTAGRAARTDPAEPLRGE